MKRTKKFYIVLYTFKKTESKTVFGHGMTIHLSDKGSGICGMMPVFTNRRKAEKWAEGRQIVTVEELPK